MIEYHQIRASVNVACIKDGKILLSRRQNKSWGNGLLVLPGGHMEMNETPRQAARRELQEELGLDIPVDRLAFYCVAHRKSDEADYVAYEFEVILDSHQDVRNAEPYECSELIWVDPEHLPEETIADFKDIITVGYLGKNVYLELGYD